MAAPIPRLSGGGARFGHLQALRHDPLGLFRRVRAECGELGGFRLLDREVVLFSGPAAQETFFRQPDEVFDPQPTSNELMRPIFGPGVVYDVPPEKRRDMIRSPALRDKNLRASAEIIAEETERMCATLGEEGTIDLLDFAAELTIYTSSATLIGRPFRESLTREFSRRYFELEVGTDAIGYLHSGANIEAFRVRDRARERLVELVSEVIRERQGGRHSRPPRSEAEPSEGHQAGARDLLDILLSLKAEDGVTARYSPSVITGILISTMFAGHHTSAGTAAWLLVEMLRDPAILARVLAELDALYADGRDVSYQALREMPQLENAVKETLRLHPPLIWLPRTALVDFEYRDWVVPKGTIVAMSSALSHEDADCFAEPRRFDPDRFAAPREEDAKHPWAYVPFGGGRHRCLGANFALMQQKAVWSVLLRRFAFELAAPPASYRDNYAAMVVRPKQPFEIRYRRRH
jgi:sterol 14alpha-demethylase